MFFRFGHDYHWLQSLAETVETDVEADSIAFSTPIRSMYDIAGIPESGAIFSKDPDTFRSY